MRLTIAKKLNIFVVVLFIATTFGIFFLAADIFSSDMTTAVRRETLEVSAMLAGRVRTELRRTVDRGLLLALASLEDFKRDEDKLKFVERNLSADMQMIGLSQYQMSAPASAGAPSAWVASWRATRLGIGKKIVAADFDRLDREHPIGFDSVLKGEIKIIVGKLSDGTAILRIGVPFVKQGEGVRGEILVLEVFREKLTALFGEASPYMSYLVDRRGMVIASTEPSVIALGQDLKRTQSILAAIGEGSVANNGRFDFVDAAGEKLLAAYQRVGFGGLTVITQAPASVAAQALDALVGGAVVFGGAVLFIALFLMFILVQGMTGPVHALNAAAAKVATGDFSVRVRSKSERGEGDEIQSLSFSFNQMVVALADRERVRNKARNTFAKFHSKEMAERILAGDLKLGGERKFATVFFSDIRGFTQISEGLDPQELVKILNRYMSRMVDVILKNGGTVDKYVGDSIMAVWGVPVSRKGDCVRAVRACLEMRMALEELNAEFITEGLPLLKMGMGLNYGQLVSGNIGSEARMEFTVIGDTVNTASRVESLTKEFGTDLLISQTLLDQVQDKFIVEKVHEVRVKGKAQPLAIYKVKGYIEEHGIEVIIETPFSDYPPEKRVTFEYEDQEDARSLPGASLAEEYASDKRAALAELPIALAEHESEQSGSFDLALNQELALDRKSASLALPLVGSSPIEPDRDEATEGAGLAPPAATQGESPYAHPEPPSVPIDVEIDLLAEVPENTHLTELPASKEDDEDAA